MGRSTARPPSPRQLAPALGLVAAGGAAGFGLGKAGMWENDGDIWGNDGKISGKYRDTYPCTPFILWKNTCGKSMGSMFENAHQPELFWVTLPNQTWQAGNHL